MRQRGEIEELAKQQNCEIVEWYEDHGLTGTESASRPNFQRMMNDATARKFSVILLYEQSRFSREDIFEVVGHLRRLKEANVRIFTCQRGEMRFENLGDFLTTIIGAHSSHDESVKIGMRVASGMRAKLVRGERVSGNRIFGYDREYTDELGNKHVIHFRDKFTKPKTWKFQLIPSKDTAAVEAVRFCFQSFVAGKKVRWISKELNKKKIKTVNGGRFDWKKVFRILSNPAYIGTLKAGFRCTGKFGRVDKNGPIIVEKANAALIDERTFYQAQARYEAITSRREFSQAGTYLLSGKLECGLCGCRLVGHVAHYKNEKYPRKKTVRHFYACRSIGSEHKDEPGFVHGLHTSVAADWLEKIVIDEVKKQLSVPRIAKALKNAIATYNRQDGTELQIKQNRLRNILDQIARGEDNLGAAETNEDFKAVSQYLVRLRKQRDELQSEISFGETATKLDAETTDALGRFAEAVDALASGSRVELKLAFYFILQAIRVERIRTVNYGPLITKTRNGKLRKLRSDSFKIRIEFKPGIFDVDSVEIETDSEITNVNWRPMIDFVLEEGRPVPTREIVQKFKCDYAVALNMLKRAANTGFLKYYGRLRTGGWVSAETPEEVVHVPDHIAETVAYVNEAGRVLERWEVAESLNIGKTTALARLDEAAAMQLIRKVKIGPNMFGYVPQDANLAILAPATSITEYEMKRHEWCAFIAGKAELVQTSDFASQFGFTKATALNRLNHLHREGFISRIGGRMGGWRIRRIPGDITAGSP
ncbi:MAG: recombinase family protein [Pirellulales bacterium]